MGGDPSYVVGPFAHKEDRPESLGVTLTPPLREFGLSEPQFPHWPNGDASDSSTPCRAQAGGSRWQAVRGSSLTWALRGGCRVESELAEMGSEAGLRRGHCWQTRWGGVRAGMGWGALRRRLLPPPAQESGGGPGWGPSLLEAGLGGACWTQAGAAEWGCGGRRGCELKMGGGSTGRIRVAVEARGGAWGAGHGGFLCNMGWHQLPPSQMQVTARSWAWGSADTLCPSVQPQDLSQGAAPVLSCEGLLLPSGLVPVGIPLSLAPLGPLPLLQSPLYSQRSFQSPALPFKSGPNASRGCRTQRPLSQVPPPAPPKAPLWGQALDAPQAGCCALSPRNSKAPQGLSRAGTF